MKEVRMTTVMRRPGSLAAILAVLVVVPWLEGCGHKAEEELQPTPPSTMADTTTAAAPLDTTVVAEPIAANDRAMESLSQANIAFNAPQTMNVTETTQIKLLLSLTRKIEDLEKDLVRSPGGHEGATIRVSERMEARLSGADFSITALTPEEQAVTSVSETEWRWEVQPTKPGRHQLHLTLTALLMVGGTTTAKAVRTFDKVIDVEVTLGQRLSGFVSGNWQWLWAVVVVPVGAWIWRNARKGKKKPDSEGTA
jgi:hypothetical protein